MTGYHEWLAQKRREQFSNFKAQRGFEPEWPPVDTIKRRKYEEVIGGEDAKPFNRRRILFNALYEAERDLAFTTRWLAEAEWNGAAAVNREHFLDWRWDANDRYARVLRLIPKLPLPEEEPNLL